MAKEITQHTDAVIPVDVGRLSTGLKTVFYGVSEIFGSIGTDEEAAGLIAGSAEKLNQPDHQHSLPGVAAGEKRNTGAASAASGEAAAGAKEEKSAEEASADPPEEKAKAEGKAVETPGTQPKKSTVTMPEIIRIVTKKIETDRKNSSKIGNIVKSFGISKLTELPENKYEAFLTQLTAL